MLITADINFDLSEMDIEKLIQIALNNSAREIQRTARENAPYDTGKLKQGIAIDPGVVAKGVDFVRVGPRSIPYAEKREYENYKNPGRKFYMKRTHEVANGIAQKNFQMAYNIVTKDA